MEKRRSGIAVGIALVLLGLWFLVVQFVPFMRGWFSWPMILVGVGLFLGLIGITSGEAGMAIPACIVAGIGGLLLYQNKTGNWESWAYAWTLIPGFVGVGTLISGVLGRDGEQVKGGVWLLVISALLYVAFASFFGALGLLGQYWPVLLIVLGFVLLVQGFVRRK